MNFNEFQGSVRWISIHFKGVSMEFARRQALSESFLERLRVADDGHHGQPAVVDLRREALGLLLGVLDLLAVGDAKGSVTCPRSL